MNKTIYLRDPEDTKTWNEAAELAFTQAQKRSEAGISRLVLRLLKEYVEKTRRKK